MQAVEFTSEWLSNQHPHGRTEIWDRGEGSRRKDDRSGLVVRIGPGGASKVFFRFADARNETTGKVRRKRVRIGAWPAVSLADARKAVLAARATERPAAAGSLALSVAQLAEAYRRDILAQREPASLAWSWGIIRTHVLAAKPDAKRPPFGEWLARDVRPPDVAAVIRTARVERTVEVESNGKKVTRALGGPAAARATLREIKAMFAAGVGSGSLEMSPAAILQAKALGLKKTPRGRKLDADEMEALFAALDLTAILDGTAKEQKLSETVRLGIALLFYAPVRSHSLIAAEWREIDLDAGRWTIPASKLKLHKDARVEARAFAVPLPGTAVAILRRLRDLAPDSPWVLASPRPPSTPKAKPRHIAPKVLVRALARLQESGRLALGSRFTVHDARRTWRSWAGELGVSFEVAERSLAHVLPGIAETYARADLVEQRAGAAEVVAAALDRVRLGKAAPVVPLAERAASAKVQASANASAK